MSPSQSATLDAIEALTAADFIRALMQVADRLDERQLAMFATHRAAPRRTLTATQLAHAAGYDEYRATNSRYGTAGRVIGEALGLRKPGNWTQVLAYGQGDDPGSRQFRWRLREPFVRALEQMGLVVSVDAGTVRAAVQTLRSDPDYRSASPAERQVLAMARIGQGGYRRALLRIWDARCAVTGLNVPGALVASHTKPWSMCASKKEKLDPYNGLLLAATVDRFFDAGLVSFADDGTLLAKPGLTPAHLQAAGLPKRPRLRRVSPRHRPYLRAHRTTHGFE